MSNKRWYVWLPLLLGSAAASLWGSAGKGEDDVVQAVDRAQAEPFDRPRRAVLVEEVPRIAVLERRELQENFGGLFRAEEAGKRVVMNQPPAETPPPPPQPLAPPMPLRFIGRMTQKDQPMLFVTWGDRNFALKVGDVADGAYRLDKVNESRAEFTYLPLGLQQTLTLQGGN